jgi:hypothetical protein
MFWRHSHIPFHRDDVRGVLHPVGYFHRTEKNGDVV